MDYYVKEIQIGDGVKKTAGIKARDDLYSIMQSLNMNETKIFEYVLQTVNKEKLAEMLTHHTLGGVTASDIEEHFQTEN